MPTPLVAPANSVSEVVDAGPLLACIYWIGIKGLRAAISRDLLEMMVWDPRQSVARDLILDLRLSRPLAESGC